MRFFFLPVSAVCFLEPPLFILDVLLRAHRFTLVRSEDVRAEPSAHKQKMAALQRLSITEGGLPSIMPANKISENPDRGKGC